MLNLNKSNNNSVGDTDLGKRSDTDDKLSRLLAKTKTLEKQAEDSGDANLDAINEIVGIAHEENIPRELLIPAPDEWNVFPPATEDNIIKIAASIYKYGLLHRVTVWKQANGKYMILGGHTRTSCFDYLYEATKEKRYRVIPARVYDFSQLSEDDAHRIFIVSNTDQRTMSLQTITAAYCDLIKLEKKKAFYGSGIYARDAAAKQANVAPSTFSRYISLQKLIEPLFGEATKGTITIKTAYYLSLLPREMQIHLYETGSYTTLSTPAAKQLKSAKNIEELDKILDEINSSKKYYKYTINSARKKDKDMDIIPVFVNKDRKKEFIEKYVQAIKESGFDENLKKDLIAGLQG